MELNSELERLQKYNEIDAELTKAKLKHPNYPTDIFHQLANNAGRGGGSNNGCFTSSL